MQAIDNQQVIFYIVSKLQIVSDWFLESYTMLCNFGPNKGVATFIGQKGIFHSLILDKEFLNNVA